MANSDLIEVDGTVTKNLPGDYFEVELENGHTLKARPSGKLRVNFIRILVGDKVSVRISPYDLNNAIITWRYK